MQVIPAQYNLSLIHASSISAHLLFWPQVSAACKCIPFCTELITPATISYWSLVLQIMDFTFLTGMRQAKLMSPPWLSHLAGDAQVEVNCLRVLQAFVAPEDGGTDLKSLIKSTIGEWTIFHGLCSGLCMKLRHVTCTCMSHAA